MDTRSPTAALLEPLPIPIDRLYPISLDLYHKMAESGLITKDDKVVLLDGLLVKKYAPPSSSREPWPAADIWPERLYRMTTEVYHDMAAHGLLSPHDKVELLNGLLVKKMTRGAPHVTVTQRLVDTLNDFALKGWYVRKEDPITLPDGSDGGGSEPEPDVVVARGRRDDYEDHHPGPEDVALVVEVARSSVREDRAALPVYAWAGIPVAWIVNQNEKQIEIYSRPTGPSHQARYQEVAIFTETDEIPVVIDNREIGRVSVKTILR